MPSTVDRRRLSSVGRRRDVEFVVLLLLLLLFLPRGIHCRAGMFVHRWNQYMFWR
jgi:hypothetical protein